MTVYYTSDTHFGHANIIKFCQRPFDDVHEMNKRLIENWNSCVQTNDLVIHIGDFGSPKCKDPRPYLQYLNGTIILVRGNHDKSKMIKHMPFWVYNIDTRIGKYNCLINHRPIYPKNMRDHNDPYHDHDNNIVNPGRYDFIISGHIHEKRLWSGRSFNVGVDVHDYMPITESKVLEYLEKRVSEPEYRR